MKKKKVVSLTQARNEIFNLANDVQENSAEYTLTERGVPKVVMISAKKFEKIKQENKEKKINENSYQQNSPATFVARDDTRPHYLPLAEEKQKKQEEDLIKARLLVDLTENYQYVMDMIEIDRYLKVGKVEGRKYMEADLVVSNFKGEVRVVVEVSTFADYEKNLEVIVSDLFDLAEVLSKPKKPKYLIYFSNRSLGGGKLEKKIMTIDFEKFETFQQWKEAGSPSENKIPVYENF